MFGFMKRKMPPPTFTEYAVFGLLVSVVLFGVFFSVFSFFAKGGRGGSNVSVAVSQPTPVAPTASQYQDEVRGVMAPFLEQAQKMTSADFSADNSAMNDLATKTQDRMIGIRVPKEYKDAHLSFVLLLAQWSRALGGSVTDQAAVLQKTAEVIAADPWLTMPAAAPVK
jgi:hypothetical protein